MNNLAELKAFIRRHPPQDAVEIADALIRECDYVDNLIVDLEVEMKLRLDEIRDRTKSLLASYRRSANIS